MSFWPGLVVWVVISPILVVLISSRKLLNARLVSLRHLHDFNVFVHVNRICLPPVRKLVEVDTLLIHRPNIFVRLLSEC